MGLRARSTTKMYKSKSPSLALTEDEIDEELVNDDLLKVGGVEDDVQLQEMKLEEKKNLLRGIQQSKDECSSQTDSRLLNKSSLEISAANFPSLPTAGKSNNNNNNGSRNKLKLPRRSIKAVDSDDSSDKCISLLDDEEETFSLPFCTNDDAPALPFPERLLKRVKNPYYVIKGETPASALKRMLAYHDKWKAFYTAEISRIESNALGENIEEDTDIKEDRNSVINDKNEEKDCDPYSFTPDSPCASKFYNEQRKRDTETPGSTGQPASRQIQRKISRDSDCEEVEPILKPEQPKLNEWTKASNTRHKSKRNKKQSINNQEKDNNFERSPDVQFDFNNKWDSKTASWGGAQSPTSSSLNNQLSTRRSASTNPIADEKKVECPLCQKYFGSSKIEAHAANCEGCSDSPMDVEEGS